MLEVHADGGEVLVEVADDVKDMHTISDDLAHVVQGIGHGLELAAVVSDGDIILDEVVEGGVEIERPLLAAAEKMVFQGKPDRTGSGVVFPDNSSRLVEAVPRSHIVMTQSMRSQSA
jgi:hypothetical protein